MFKWLGGLVDSNEKEIARLQKVVDRITNIGRGISLVIVILGTLGAYIAQWQNIWASALGVAGTMVVTQLNRERHRFLAETYSRMATKLDFAKAEWSISKKQPADDSRLISYVESCLADENAGWAQQMLLKPMSADEEAAVSAPATA